MADPLLNLFRPYIPAESLEQVVADFRTVIALPVDQEAQGRPALEALLRHIPRNDRVRVFERDPLWSSPTTLPLLNKWCEDVRFEDLLSELQMDFDSAANGDTKAIVVESNPFRFVDCHRPDWSLRLVQKLDELDLESRSTGMASLTITARDLVSAGSNTSSSSSTGGNENLSAWTEYVEKCQSFQCISVDLECNGPFTTDEVTGQDNAKSLLESIASNSRLTTVRLFIETHGEANERKLPYTHFLPLLRAKESLRRLDLDTIVVRDDDRVAFAHALGANRSLDTIKLHLSGDGDLALFPELAKIPTLKNALLLQDCDDATDYQGGTATFIEDSNTLEQLSLDQFRFTEDGMNRIKDAMSARPSLTKMHIDSCYFHDNSAQLLVDAVHGSDIDEFRLHLHLHRRTPADVRFSVQAFHDLWTNRTDSLTVIDCHFPWNADCELSQWLVVHADEICVPCLRLRGWKQELLPFVQGLRQVENVEIVLVGNDVLVFDNIKRMVKDNVSLHKVSAYTQDMYMDPTYAYVDGFPTNEVLIPATTAEETALLDAYGQRNEFLRPLLAGAVAETADQDSSKPVVVADATDQDSSETDWFSSCVPSLVAVGLTMPPPHTANTFFAGMLAVDANQNDSVAHAPEEKSIGSTGKR